MLILRIFLFIAALFFLLLPAPGFAWDGRMAGAGDAYGLIEDESDFLIHPAAITPERNLNIYGTYRLTYDNVPQWDNIMCLPSENDDYTYKAKGHEWRHEGQAGMAFPLGTGRIGIFFEYLGKRAKYGVDETDWAHSQNDHKFKLESEADNFNLRAIYGRPFGNIKLGGEIQISHKDEENKNILDDPSDYIQNYYKIASSPALDLYKYMMPFRSDYYETLEKLSLEGELGTVKNIFTIKGGVTFPFASNNKFNYSDSAGNEVSMAGEVNSWNAGFDYWVRFPLNKDISLPFILGVWHKQIKRDGSGSFGSGMDLSYRHQEENTGVTAGGGADLNLNSGARIAAGLYYDYSQKKQNMNTREISAGTTDIYDYPEYPSKKENRITLKALTEINLSSGFTFLSGLNVFYGKMMNNFHSNLTRNAVPRTDVESSANGYNCGANLSFGTVFKTGKINIEPFINAGFCKYKVNGDGYFDGVTVDTDTTNKSEKTDWIIGGGLSIKY